MKTLSDDAFTVSLMLKPLPLEERTEVVITCSESGRVTQTFGKFYSYSDDNLLIRGWAMRTINAILTETYPD